MGRQAKYDEAFKQNAVGLVRSGHKAAAVARDLGLNPETLYQWVRKEKDLRDGGVALVAKGSGHAGAQRSLELDREFAVLRKEHERLKLEHEILKKAVGIFSRTPR
jgi:transposase